MALLMSNVSSVPDAPTRTPATTSIWLWRTNPVSAAASPVSELRIEITTGMSPPPIGRTNIAPSRRAAANRAHNVEAPPLVTTITPSTMTAIRIRPLTTRCSGNCNGRPGRIS